MRRRLLILGLVLSVVWTASVAGLWLRSFWLRDSFNIGRWTDQGFFDRTLTIQSIDGGIAITLQSRGNVPKSSATSYEWDLSSGARWGRSAGWRSHVGFRYQDWTFITLSDRTPTRSRTLLMPHWVLILPALLLPVVALVRYRQAKWARAGLCPHCGYDLRATPDRCPECGHAPAEHVNT
jgi:hypothetical protein